ncbi:MAG: glutaconate CoA-transferase [Firmicutes bacterium]|nr:glutaconate CoA-transferase [Bacillota bacterium]
MASLIMSCEEAVNKLVHDGDTIAIGGFTTNRKPYALVREIIRQNKKDLYIEGSGAGGETDLLIGASCVKSIVNAYISNGAFGNVGRCFRKAIEQGEIEFEDYSLDVQPLRFHAAALGLPFIPVRNLLIGSDIETFWGIPREKYDQDPKLPPAKLLVRENPFNPEEQLVYLPVPKIDVALIHVQKVATDGTVRIEGPTFVDVDLAMAADRLIVGFEELVEPRVLRNEPWLNQIPLIIPDACVHLPFGAHPSQCTNYYDYDPDLMYLYDHACQDQSLYSCYLNDYIYSLKDHNEYIKKIGSYRLNRLRVGDKNYVENLKRGNTRI